MNRLQDKVVIVTGASSGIGEALARLFAEEGASVTLAARSWEKLQALAASIGASALPVRTDVTDATQIREMVRLTVERFGRIDILVNNAGVGMHSSVAKMLPGQFEQLTATNWFGPVYAIQEVVPHMRKQGGGQIINISSVVGKVSIPWMAAYSASKFALNAMSDALRIELAKDNIGVLTVCPGAIETPFSANAFKTGTAPNFSSSKIPAERVARAVLRAALKRKREIVVPASNWGFIWLHTLFPGFIDAMMARFLRRRFRKAGTVEERKQQ